MVTMVTNTGHHNTTEVDKLYFTTQTGSSPSADLLPLSPDLLLGKVVCLLYGAAWSPPFLDFLSVFRQFYTELKSNQAPVQVVYVSFDRSREETRELVRGFPESWVSVPHSSSLVNYLKLKFSVVVIPRLVVVTDSGQLITDKGVREVRRRAKRCFVDWYNAAKCSETS
ncbi:hypothetical protein ACHWQZ_G004906 [Mnemiopsis leidyi]